MISKIRNSKSAFTLVEIMIVVAIIGLLAALAIPGIVLAIGLPAEAAFPARLSAALKAKGHEVRSVNGGAVGGYQGILFTRDARMPAPIFDPSWAREDRPVNGVYRGGSDHRKDGQAVGW